MPFILLPILSCLRYWPPADPWFLRWRGSTRNRSERMSERDGVNTPSTILAKDNKSVVQLDGLRAGRKPENRKITLRPHASSV